QEASAVRRAKGPQDLSLIRLTLPLRREAPRRGKVSQRGVCLLADPSCDGWGVNKRNGAGSDEPAPFEYLTNERLRHHDQDDAAVLRPARAGLVVGHRVLLAIG